MEQNELTLELTEARARETLAIIIGSLRLEGLEPSAESLADMELVITRKITINDAIERILEKVSREQIRTASSIPFYVQKPF